MSSPFFLLLEPERTRASTVSSFLFRLILRMVSDWPESAFMMSETKLMKISHPQLRPPKRSDANRCQACFLLDRFRHLVLPPTSDRRYTLFYFHFSFLLVPSRCRWLHHKPLFKEINNANSPDDEFFCSRPVGQPRLRSSTTHTGQSQEVCFPQEEVG